jgi:hypothetical protein
LQDWDALRDACHERGMKLVMDLVVNHTSEQVSEVYPLFHALRALRAPSLSLSLPLSPSLSLSLPLSPSLSLSLPLSPSISKSFYLLSRSRSLDLAISTPLTALSLLSLSHYASRFLRIYLQRDRTGCGRAAPSVRSDHC